MDLTNNQDTPRCPKCKLFVYVKYVADDECYYCSNCKIFFIPKFTLGSACKSRRAAKYRKHLYNVRALGKERNLHIRNKKSKIKSKQNSKNKKYRS